MCWLPLSKPHIGPKESPEEETWPEGEIEIKLTVLIETDSELEGEGELEEKVEGEGKVTILRVSV